MALRWWIVFGGSFLAAAAFLIAALSTHETNGWIGFLLFAPVIGLPVVWGYALCHWALSSDENARVGAVPAVDEAGH